MTIITDTGIIKRGRAFNVLISERILEILATLPIATPQRIKEQYEQLYQVPVSWNTIANRLTELVMDGKIFMLTTTQKAECKGKFRSRINKVYSLQRFM
jgi:hypothetical protein